MRPCDYGIGLSIWVSELNAFVMAEGSCEYTANRFTSSRLKVQTL